MILLCNIRRIVLQLKQIYALTLKHSRYMTSKFALSTPMVIRFIYVTVTINNRILHNSATIIAVKLLILLGLKSFSIEQNMPLCVDIDINQR